MAELDDPFPLDGPGHNRLGLSSGEWDVYYDELRVTPATGSDFAPAAAAPPEPAAGPFSDDFDRAQLGPDWLATDPAVVSIQQGAAWCRTPTTIRSGSASPCRRTCSSTSTSGPTAQTGT